MKKTIQFLFRTKVFRKQEPKLYVNQMYITFVTDCQDGNDQWPQESVNHLGPHAVNISVSLVTVIFLRKYILLLVKQDASLN